MIVVLPILTPLITALIGLIAWGNSRIQRLASVVGSAVGVVIAVILLLTVQENGIQVLYVGNWVAPFGITLVADLFSAIMVTITAFMGLMVAIYALVDIDKDLEVVGYHSLYQFLLVGVTGSFLTGDLFNLFVWFEIMLLSSFVMLTLMGKRAQIEGAVKYVIMNMLSSVIFLASIGLLYGVTGTVNMADLANRVSSAADQRLSLIISLAMLFTVAFGMKAAIFPLFSWLPASYHTPPTAITTIFGALLTKVGVYALIRVYTLIFNTPEIFNYAQIILLLAAGLTMVIGVFGAVAQYGFRRLLSFHIVSQIGYLIMGLAIFTVASLAGTIFYLVHVILAKSALFLVSGIVYRLTGTYDLKKLGGFYHNNMALSMLFFIPAIALAGIPPLSGFWAKFAIIKAGLEAGNYWIIGTGLFVSVFTLYSMIKIWTYAFMRKRPEAYQAPLNTIPASEARLLWIPTVVIGLATILMGIFAGPLFELSTAAAEQLMNTEMYITAVLGGTQ